MGSNLDVEYLIEALDHICVAGPSLRSIEHDTSGLETAEKVRAEVEWFVQHVAERVTAEDARLMWGSVLQAIKIEKVTITFVTTNYDRAIRVGSQS